MTDRLLRITIVFLVSVAVFASVGGTPVSAETELVQSEF